MKFFHSLLRVVAISAWFIFPSTSDARSKVVAYLPNWIDLDEFAKTIQFSKVTHINIAFENPVDDLGNLSFNHGDEVILKMAKAAGVKVLVSIGGGGASGNEQLKARYFKLMTDETRPVFVKNLAAYVSKHGFDGLDVDIEGPSINNDYGHFIADLSAALKPQGKLLTAALSRGYGGDRVPDAALANFDFVNIMAYDATGTWDRNRPGQHSSLDFAKSQVAYWIAHGLPASKAVLGVPFYGYGFGEAWRNQGYSYAEIVRATPAAAQLDETAATIYYNGIPTIRSKAEYSLEQQLGGIMIWSLDQDAPGKLSLLSALDEVLRANLVPAK